jgi:hypothetical protein
MKGGAGELNLRRAPCAYYYAPLSARELSS